MKIRTDFVTNSSSTATTELVVENPVLLEILERYKKLGAFGEEGTTFGIGEYATPPSDIYYFGRHKMTEIPKPAFSFREDPGGDGWDVGHWVPESLSEVLELIIYIMDQSKNYRCSSYENYYEFNHYDSDLYSQMIEELKQQEDRINMAYTKVNHLRTDDDESVDGILEDLLGEELYEKLYEELYEELDGVQYDEVRQAFNYSQEAGGKVCREAVRYDEDSGEYVKWEIDVPNKE